MKRMGLLTAGAFAHIRDVCVFVYRSTSMEMPRCVDVPHQLYQMRWHNLKYKGQIYVINIYVFIYKRGKKCIENCRIACYVTVQ